MKKTNARLVRIIVLFLGLVLAACIIWQLLSGAGLTGFNIQSQGPLVVVVLGLMLLFTLGAAFSFFADQHLVAPVFLSCLLAIIAFVLWIRQPAQAELYRLCFLYALLVLLLSPLALTHH